MTVSFNFILLLVACVTPLYSLQLPNYHKQYYSPSSPIDAVQGLVQRIIPQYNTSFNWVLISPDDNGDVFEVEGNSNSTVTIRGNSGVALASGLHHYLKYVCNAQVSWTGDQLSLPSVAPSEFTKIRIVMVAKYRYYFNTCTFGYTTAWWNWARWQREIDWMALNGINMPLAFTGQESIWYDVYSALGLNDTEINAYFTGPAFLPWNRMGNVNGWGGGLTKSWRDAQQTLQQQILSAMRSFGMTPILPAFAGHVPAAMQTHFPKSNITQLASWAGYPGTYYLDSSDPLFAKIAVAFIKQQTAIYGTDHYYNADPFNELIPPSNDTSYLSGAGKALYLSMANADSMAIWVMQGWFLHFDASFWQPPQAKAFLTAIPPHSLIMLDLWAEKNPVWASTDGFYGQEFIWCMLNNFGGRTSIFGNLANITEGPLVAYQDNSNFVGIGLTPEGTNTNYIQYDLMTEMAWRVSQPQINLDDWVDQYTIRRYGLHSLDMDVAWRLLQDNVYNCGGTQWNIPDSFVALRPNIAIPGNCDLCYDGDVIAQILYFFVHAITNTSEITRQATFSHDIASVTRQMLNNAFMKFHTNMMNDFNAKNMTGFQQWSNLLLGTIEDIDTIVSTQEMWLVGRWIADARQWATNAEEAAMLEFNARNQITLWGPATSDLHDYAWKLWGGLVRDFYYPRWLLLVQMLGEDLQNGQPFDYNTFDQQVQPMEYAWTLKNNTYSTTPTGDPFAIATELFAKYEQYFDID